MKIKKSVLAFCSAAVLLSSCGSSKVEEKPVEEESSVETVEETVEQEPVKTVDNNDYTERNKKLLEEVEKARLKAIKAGAEVYWKKSKVFYGSFYDIAKAMLKEAESVRQNAVAAGAEDFYSTELSASDAKKSAIETEFNQNQKVDYSERLGELIAEYELLENNSIAKAKAILAQNKNLYSDVVKTRNDAVEAGADVYWKDEKIAFTFYENNETKVENISFPETDSKKDSVKSNIDTNPRKDFSVELNDLVARYRSFENASKTKSLFAKVENARNRAIESGASVYFDTQLEIADKKRDAVKADFESNPNANYTTRLTNLIAEYDSMLDKAKDWIKDIPVHNKTFFAKVEKARENAIDAGAERYLKEAKVAYVSSSKNNEEKVELISLSNTDEIKNAQKAKYEENPNVDLSLTLKDLVSKYETLEKASITKALFNKVNEARANAIDSKADVYVKDELDAADAKRDIVSADFDKNAKIDYSVTLNNLISEYDGLAEKSNDIQERAILAKEGDFISFPGTDVKSDNVTEAFEDLSKDHTEELQDLIERYKTLEKAAYTQAIIDNTEAARTKAIEAGANKYFASSIEEFDAKKNATKVSFKNNPRADYSRVLNDLSEKYKSLEYTSSAKSLKEKVESLNSKDLDVKAKIKADSEIESYENLLMSGANGSVLVVQAEKAYLAYKAVANKAYYSIAMNEKKEADSAKKMAESEKAQVNKYTKDSYKETSEAYKVADKILRNGDNEEAYNSFKNVKESYLEQYNTVKKAKGEAVSAQEKSQKSKTEAESFAAAADATNPLTKQEKGIEDENVKLLKDDNFANPEDSVINVDVEDDVEVKDSINNAK